MTEEDGPIFKSVAPDVEALRKLARRSHSTEEYRRKFWAIDYVQLYPKGLELFELGLTKTERLAKWANQAGKSFHLAVELSYHATGRYPSWWKGCCFDKAPAIWIASESSQTLRDVMQKLLFGEAGDPEAFGTGTIPLDLIDPRISMARTNVSDCYDTARIKHVSGGKSRIQFRSYKAGVDAFKGVTLQFVAFDEEPPFDVIR